MYLNNNLSKLVPRIINKYIKAGYKIEIKITQSTIQTPLSQGQLIDLP